MKSYLQIRILFLVVIFSSCNVSNDIYQLYFDHCPENKTFDDNSLKIIGHRGAIVEAPENTIPSFEKAVNLGVDIVELDIRMSRDNVLVVFHDETLERTTNGRGPLAAYTWKELKKLDAGSWYSEDFKEIRIPSLLEVFQWHTGKDIQLLLDVKVDTNTFIQKLTQMVYENINPNNIIIGVWSENESIKYCQHLPEVNQIAFLKTLNKIPLFAKTPVKFIHTSISNIAVRPELVRSISRTNKYISISGSMGSVEETNEILSYSPNWIMTDNPRELGKSLQKIERVVE